MKIAITGHRPNKLDNDYDLKSPLIGRIKEQIIKIITSEYTHSGDAQHNSLTLITGMALGIDTLFALIAIELDIPFIAAIPCINQSALWSDKSKTIWKYLTGHNLCTVEYPNGHIFYTGPQLMQLRNQWMVDNCDILIAVWDNSPGGTANCIRYAKLHNKHIIFINPDAYRTNDLKL